MGPEEAGPNKTSEITLEKEEARVNITISFRQLCDFKYESIESSLFGSFFDIDIIKIWKGNYLSSKL